MSIELIAIPRTSSISEDAIIQQLLAQTSPCDPSATAALYEDDDFSPTDLSSLYIDPHKRPEYASTDASVFWYRPTEYTDDPDYFKATSGCGVLREGALADAWLLGVFAALALHPDNLIENLFVSDSLHGFKQFGLFTCRFYKNCRWVNVTTDTRVPYGIELSEEEERGCADTPGHLLYGGSLNKNEVFVPFLEKAYAKLHGSYQALALDGQGNGSVSSRILEALLDCTGGSAVRVDLLDEKRRVGEDGDSSLSHVWKRLVKYKKRRCVVTAQLKQLSFNSYDLTPLGILKNRQYVVMHVKEVVVGAGGGTGPGQGAPTATLRFVKLKNVWGRGMWKGEWSNDDSKWEEHMQVELALRNDTACEFSRSGTDGCFWMVWEDFIENFNEMYVAYVFGNGEGEENVYHQYCVTGDWVGYSAAGAPVAASGQRPATTTSHIHDELSGDQQQPDAKKERPIDRTKWSVLADADPNWHRNPQFKLSVEQRTSGVLVSLAQRDFRLYGGDNYAINVVLLKQKAGRTSVVWEFTRHKLAAEAHSFESNNFFHHAEPTTVPPPFTAGSSGSGAMSGTGKQLPEREIVKEDLTLEPDASYYLVPYTDHAKVEMEFFLRVFSPKPVYLERVESVHTALQQGKWRNEDTASGDGTSSGDPIVTTSSSAGGPLCTQLFGGDENAAWCQNPQFWLRLRPMETKRRAQLLATRSSATIKIIVRKTTTKSGVAGVGGVAKSRMKELSKERFNLVGITVLRARTPCGGATDDDALGEKKERRGAGPGAKSASNAGNHVSLARAQAKGPKTNFLGEIIEKPQWKTSGFQRKDDAKKPMSNDDEGEAKGPDFKPGPMVFPPPRLVVNPDEWCRVSDYSSPLVACLHLRKLPKEWLLDEHGGLMIVPTLGEAGAEGSFDVQVDSDFPLLLDELPRFTTQSVPGEWEAGNAVGCHLHSEWKKNPKFYLHLKGVRPAKVKITLTRSELEWMAKCKRDAVGTMMGFYLFHGQRLTRVSEHQSNNSGAGGGTAFHSIIVNGRPWSETDFVPLHSVASPPELMLPAAFNEPYVIMPATYEPGKTGRFVISVQCDTEFTLTNEEP